MKQLGMMILGLVVASSVEAKSFSLSGSEASRIMSLLETMGSTERPIYTGMTRSANAGDCQHDERDDSYQCALVVEPVGEVSFLSGYAAKSLYIFLNNKGLKETITWVTKKKKLTYISFDGIRAESVDKESRANGERQDQATVYFK